MRKWIVRFAVLGLLVAAVFVLRATVMAPDPVPVEVIEVARGLVQSTVTNTRAGTVEARRRAQLSPEIAGLVIELPHAEGSLVEAGDVLVRMDSTSQDAQLALARASLAAVRARHVETCVQARRAERELDRNRRLESDELVSADLIDKLESALESAEASCNTASAQVDEAQARVRVAEAELAKTAIRAPFAGVIAELSVEVGEYVTPAPPGVPIPAVIDLVDTSSIYVSAPMDEVDSAVLRAGQSVRVSLDPFPDVAYPGRLARVAPYVLDVEEQNRTVEVEVELEDVELAARLLPGTSADVEVILDEHPGVLRIPTGTLLEGGRVLVFDADGLVERRVRVGLKNWDWTEVLDGLEEGERIVSSLGDEAVVAGASAVLESAEPRP